HPLAGRRGCSAPRLERRIPGRLASTGAAGGWDGGEEVAASRGEAVSVADEGVQHVQRSWARF
ncbi:unnamed protein product, partial [Cladocopium goreaui]